MLRNVAKFDLTLYHRYFSIYLTSTQNQTYNKQTKSNNSYLMYNHTIKFDETKRCCIIFFLVVKDTIKAGKSPSPCW